MKFEGGSVDSFKILRKSFHKAYMAFHGIARHRKGFSGKCEEVLCYRESNV